jgi:hypothetical protein
MRYALSLPALGWLVLTCGAWSAFGADLDGTKATSSKAAREDALQSIPFDKLSGDARQKVNAVISRTSIFRRMPLQVVDCDPDLHLFLVRNPDVVVNIWEVMGISKVTVERIGPDSFRTADGQGTKGRIDYLYSSHDTHVIYSDGLYEGPLYPRPVRGQCVLVLKAGYIRETNGRQYVTHRLDAFIHLDNVGVELIAKTFQPLVGKSADYNFTETSAFMGDLSHTAEINPKAVKKLSERLTHIEPAVRDEFASITAAVADRAATGDADEKMIAGDPTARPTPPRRVSASEPPPKR